jgi:DNA-binding response OmpR family regulator
MDGLQALKQFQQEMDMPIIFVTARRRELNEILGLELGADNYITKPFNPDVLLAHVKATLRRTRDTTSMAASPAPIHVGDLVIDPAAHTVRVGKRPIDLAAREFAFLQALALEAGRVISVDDLLTRVWGAEFMGEPQVVYVHVRWLREKIEATLNKPNPSSPTLVPSSAAVSSCCIPLANCWPPVILMRRLKHKPL